MGPSLSCLQSECPPVQQGALYTGPIGDLLSVDLIGALEFFCLSFELPRPSQGRCFDSYLQEGLGDMSKITQQEATSLLAPPGFSLGCRGIGKQECLGLGAQWPG